MTGDYLVDLFDDIVDALPELNIAIAAVGLTDITTIGDMYAQTNLQHRPFMLVSLAGKKSARIPTQAMGNVIEHVTMDLETYIDGEQRDALLYEGVIKAWFKDHEAYFRERMEDAQLGTLHPLSSRLEIDRDARNRPGWVVYNSFDLTINWE